MASILSTIGNGIGAISKVVTAPTDIFINNALASNDNAENMAERLSSAGHSGVFIFPRGLGANGHEFEGIYKSFLHFSAIETSRVELQAAGVSSLYGHAGGTSTSKPNQSAEIFLPMPDSLDLDYAQSYSKGEIGFLEQTAADQLSGGTGNALYGMAKRALTGLGETVGVGKFQNITNSTANEKSSLTFNATELRTITLSYEFFPKSVADLKSLNDILETFKFYSAPDGNMNDQFLTIPHKWILEETPMPGFEKNIKRFNFGPAVITSVKIKQELKNQFNTGDPVKVGFDISLQETFPIFKNDMIGLDKDGDPTSAMLNGGKFVGF